MFEIYYGSDVEKKSRYGGQENTNQQNFHHSSKRKLSQGTLWCLWSNCIKTVFFSIPFHFINHKAWFEMFSRSIENQTYKYFCSGIFPLPYIVISEIGVNFSMTDLVCESSFSADFHIFWFNLTLYMDQETRTKFSVTTVARCMKPANRTSIHHSQSQMVKVRPSNQTGRMC